MAITSDVTAKGASVVSSGGVYSVLSGATLVVQVAGFSTSGAIVSGFGDGTRNSGFIPGQSGGTNYPALLLASGGGVVSGSTVGFGGVGMGVYGGTVAGGTAFDSGSFVAANGGVVSGVNIGSNGGLLASTVSGEGGGAGIVRDAQVHAGGYALAGGGFTIKGQKFAGAGIISRGNFDIGSTEILVSGGTDMGSIIGGTQIVSSAGIAMKSIFSAGTQLIYAGGVASGSIASAGGRIEVYSGGVGSGFQIGSGGSLHVGSYGTVNGVQIQAAAAASADLAAVISGATIAGGGTLTLNSGATLVSGVLSGTDSGGGAGGLLVVESGAVLSGVLKMGWKSRLDLDSILYTSGAKLIASTNSVQIVDADGNLLWSGAVAGSTSSTTADFHLERDPVDGSMILVYDKCFLKGTMIRTDRGDIAVENLVVGDRVIAFVNGKEVAREIIWTGRRSTSVRQGLPDDEAGYPVRIRRNAIAENIPNKDLLVTPEHAMFLDGAFVPARMLVNGRSIFYDRTITHFDYYHIETAEHSIIWSDGALSESYLDTGDRSAFSLNSPVVHLLNAPENDWARDAAAALRVDRDFVEPLHARLQVRADELNFGSVAPPMRITSDPDLRLIDLTGREFRAIRSVNGSHVFMVPADAEAVRIVSRTSRPVDMVGPFHDDRRHLGVLVGKIQVWEAGETRYLDAHLKTDNLSGWANREAGEHRWTTGNALLPLEGLRPDVVAMLSIEIQAGGPYPEEGESQVCGLAAG
ncbi:Hint domain-containing protein [Asaia bogorensis]|uniref:Hint domain-containing protein n=1 Tax=Asaia bogorensis TaxID=91915 RepID=UPI000EFBBCA4|nr:Hint domain-containing protein [Asaia bogorensis]